MHDAMSDNPLSGIGGGDIVLGEIESALEFFDLHAVSAALKANNFDVAEEVDKIVKHIQNPDPEISMKALQHWHRLKMDLAKANGLIITGQQTRRVREPDGSITEESFTATGLMSQLKKGNERDRIDTTHRHTKIDAVQIGGSPNLPLPAGASPEEGKERSPADHPREVPGPDGPAPPGDHGAEAS
jgi:hypothetical protein